MKMRKMICMGTAIMIIIMTLSIRELMKDSKKPKNSLKTLHIPGILLSPFIVLKVFAKALIKNQNTTMSIIKGWKIKKGIVTRCLNNQTQYEFGSFLNIY